MNHHTVMPIEKMTAVALLISALASTSPSSALATEVRNHGIIRIGDVLIPASFSQALREGMTIPVLLHFEKNSGVKEDQRIGQALLFLVGNQLKIKRLTIEEMDDGARLSAATLKQVEQIDDRAFDDDSNIILSEHARLTLDFKQMVLQLVVDEAALGTAMKIRSSELGPSSVDSISSTLDYNFGVYDSRMHASDSNTSNYLSLNSVTAYREHHIDINGSFYGLASSNRQSNLYKVMYERDFAGRRLAAGMLDSWNLQSLGAVTALNSSKIYGVSYGNKARSTQYDNSQSLTPIVAFFPSAGEVHLLRDGRLLSVQNFNMGNHEVDTSMLPYGVYDIEVDVVVNGRVASRRTQRVNKLFTQGPGGDGQLSWQLWGGMINMDRWRKNSVDQQTRQQKQSYLLGGSTAGNFGAINMAGSLYSFDNNAVTEVRVNAPLGDRTQINLQGMSATDGSWSGVGNISLRLPGDFSTIWLSQEKAITGNRLSPNDSDTRAIGGSINLGQLIPHTGTFTMSYNDNRRSDSRYYNVDYYQSVYTGRYGSLGMRAGIQRYNNDNTQGNTGKYIALDFTLPLGNWLSAGVSNQNGYTTANLAMRKNLDKGPFTTVGANVSRAIAGDTGSNNTLNGGAYAQFDTKYSKGTLNVSSSADGSVNSSLSASGSLGWQGKNIAASGKTEGNAGVIFNTGLDDKGMLTAKIDGRMVSLSGKRDYIPLSPYGQYEIELMNNKHSEQSFDIVSKRKSKLTLYPGNVAVIAPEIKQMVTVFGRIKAEDGTALVHAEIQNHIGRTQTDSNGEFSMDIDKQQPTIDFSHSSGQRCEVELDLSAAQGAIWVGDVICRGLSSYSAVAMMRKDNES